MAIPIHIFPFYNGETNDELFNGTQAFEFSYNHNGQVYNLSCNNGLIKDEDEQHTFWDADECELAVKRTYCIQNADKLYGMPNGFACEHAKIGLAVQWFSPVSHARGIIDIGIIKNISEQQTLLMTHTFEKALFKQGFGLQTILYIAEAEQAVTSEEKHFANAKGCIIGNIDEYSYIIDGEGSMFNINVVSGGKHEPLWKVNCLWNDPEQDSFTDTISIDINRDNALFKFLDNEKNNKNFDIQLYREMLSSAMSVIIETLRTQDTDLTCLDKQDLSSQSVAFVIKYLRDNLNIDLSSPISVSQSIHTHLELNLTKK